MSMEASRAKLLRALEASQHGYIEISHGTLRAYDLFHSFRNELKKWAPNGYITKKQLGFFFVPRRAKYDDGHTFWNTEDADILLHQMWDALATFAPEGYYFGANEGDGSAIGWWKGEDDSEMEHTI